MIVGLRRSVGDDRVILNTDRFVAVDIRALAGGTTADPPSLEPVALTLSMTPCPPPPSLAPMVRVEDQVDQIGESRGPWGAGVPPMRRSQESKVSGWAVDAPNRSPPPE